MSQRTDRILSLSGLLIAIVAIIVSITVPEVRRYFGLDGSGAQPASGGYSPPATAFQDSAVGPAPVDASGWQTMISDTDVTPAPTQIGASFARGEPTDTVAVAVTVPTTDTVMESSATMRSPGRRLYISDSVTSSFRNKYRQ